jgi:hypothetical protein
MHKGIYIRRKKEEKSSYASMKPGKGAAGS